MDFTPARDSLAGRTLWVETVRRQVLTGQQLRIPATPFLVRRPRQEVGQNAGTYLKCELGDQTGWIEAVWWNAGRLGAQEMGALLAAEVWSVDGVASLNRFGGRENPQVRIEHARPLLSSTPVGIPGLVRRSVRSEAELAAWLSGEIAGLRNEPLRLLLEDTLGDSGAWREGYLRVPAGLHYHHAYVGGLVDHCREMASMWLASCAIFPRVDRDLTLAGILLHDVGKLDTFSDGPAPQVAGTGKFVDHITAGIARLAPVINSRRDFPQLLRDHLLHIVASHHGEKEHGSPVIPATREALVVHHLDRLSSLLSHLEDWTRQSGVDQYGWSTEISPWLKVCLAKNPEIPGSSES